MINVYLVHCKSSRKIQNCPLAKGNLVPIRAIIQSKQKDKFPLCEFKWLKFL